MNVQPIDSYETRLQQYRAEMRRFVLCELSVIFLIAVAVGMGMAYLFTQYPMEGQTPISLDWRLFGLCFALPAMVPVYMMMKPTEPQPGDVAADRALRRAFGMDDSVGP